MGRFEIVTMVQGPVKKPSSGKSCSQTVRKPSLCRSKTKDRKALKRFTKNMKRSHEGDMVAKMSEEDRQKLIYHKPKDEVNPKASGSKKATKQKN
eukprot:NODE_3673_length_417_cov_88.081522_g3239_i0.p1 GENE.NODE_3673_length_417_cov_88.081522_g3239_i0~~NODE_3673_length_417_cov_88.081522_g3239_i0.p1  ORF type:complete len:102 (-),score=25.37 NODE_3673_length_417_cov_88.081522_g3239_i0:111-395(-)